MKPIALLCFLVAVVGGSIASHGALSVNGKPTDGAIPVVRPW